MEHLAWQGSRIKYTLTGSGPLVMLIHGFAENSSVWQHLVTALKKDFTFIIPDLPGCGGSETLQNSFSLSDISDLLFLIGSKQLGNSKFTLVGHSMGGYIAMEYARNHWETLNGLGLFHSSSLADNDSKKETRKSSIDFITKNGKELYLKTSVPNLFSEHSRNVYPNLVEELVKLGLSCNEKSLSQYQQAMIERQDTSGILKVFGEPVLFVQGQYDNAVPMENGLKQVILPPVCHFHLLKQSGHMGMWEEQEKANALLKQYFMKASR